MLKYTLIFLLISSSLFTKAQPSLWSNDPASKKIINGDCDGKIFTRVEQIPSLKIDKEAFGDSLTMLLKSRKAFHETDSVIFRFIVTTQSQIFDIVRQSGEIKKESIVKESLLSLSNLWLPAVQNGYMVCAYVQLKLIILNDALYLKVMK